MKSVYLPLRAVQPVEVEIFAVVVRLRHGGADAGSDVGAMDQVAESSRAHLHQGRSLEANPAIRLESAWYIFAMLRELVGEAHGIFERLTGALRQVLQHGMRGVAQ